MDAHMANITTDLFGNLTSDDRKRIAQAYSANALSMGKVKDYSPVVQFLTWFRDGAPKYRGYFMEIAQPDENFKHRVLVDGTEQLRKRMGCPGPYAVFIHDLEYHEVVPGVVTDE